MTKTKSKSKKGLLALIMCSALLSIGCSLNSNIYHTDRLITVQGFTCKEAWNKIPAIMVKKNAPSITIMATDYKFGQYCKYMVHFDSFADKLSGFVKPETLDR